MAKVRGLLALGNHPGMLGEPAWFAIFVFGFTQDLLARHNTWIPPGILIGMAESRA